jgi:hypothetical protein
MHLGKIKKTKDYLASKCKESDAAEKASVTAYEWLSPFSSCRIRLFCSCVLCGVSFSYRDRCRVMINVSRVLGYSRLEELDGMSRRLRSCLIWEYSAHGFLNDFTRFNIN